MNVVHLCEREMVLSRQRIAVMQFYQNFMFGIVPFRALWAHAISRKGALGYCSFPKLPIYQIYLSSSIIWSSASRDGRTTSCGRRASEFSVKFNCSIKLGAVVFT